jgi:signal transduction histidine kinase
VTDRLRRTLSLRAQLILFSALLTVAIVGVMFALLGFTVRTQTRRLLAATLSQHQARMASIQRARNEELVRASVLLTESPTLRAALETYQSERDDRGGRRGDLLETIQHEVERAASGLDRDLVVMTDRDGGILATRARDPKAVGQATAALRQAAARCAHLADDDPNAEDAPPSSSPGGFGEADETRPHSMLVASDSALYQVGCVPVALAGDVIGGLVLGDRLDRTYAERVRDELGADVLVLRGGHVVASSRPGTPADLPALAAPAGGRRDGTLVRLGDEEFVAIAVPLGERASGEDGELVLMHSLTAALATSDASLWRVMLLYAALAVVLAAVSASFLARSVLRPLDHFVAFLRQVAESRDRTRRFNEPGGPEVQTLASTYNHLMAALLEHERRLLQQAREELERMERLKESEKLAALGRMLSGAAHEINNPLAGVLGNIDLLLGDQAVPESARRRLETVRREGQRIVGLVRNLLKTVHRDDGRRAPVDLNQVARESAALRRHDFQTAGLSLELDLDPDPCLVLGSDLELQQIFLNVINNAFDALVEARTPHGQVTVRTRRDEHEMQAAFLDNGPGIKEPEKVFDHFYTTKAVGKGTGLGLSIAGAIVRNHNGRMTAENRSEGGACFILRLPAAPEGLLEEAGERTARPRSAVPEPVRRRADALRAAVLVVDDEPSVLELQIAILETHGAEVVGAKSGSEACDRLRERPFDLVVTDLKMPGSISGQDLFRWAQRERPEIARRFVFVTGDTMSEEALVFLEATGRRCVQKPFSVEGYLDVLRDTLEGRERAAA